MLEFVYPTKKKIIYLKFTLKSIFLWNINKNFKSYRNKSEYYIQLGRIFDAQYQITLYEYCEIDYIFIHCHSYFGVTSVVLTADRRTDGRT